MHTDKLFTERQRSEGETKLARRERDRERDRAWQDGTQIIIMNLAATIVSTTKCCKLVIIKCCGLVMIYIFLERSTLFCVVFAIFEYYYFYYFSPSVESVFVSHYKTKFVSRELSGQLRVVTLKKTYITMLSCWTLVREIGQFCVRYAKCQIRRIIWLYVLDACFVAVLRTNTQRGRRQEKDKGTILLFFTIDNNLAQILIEFWGPLLLHNFLLWNHSW